jgi:hypothetical protein
MSEREKCGPADGWWTLLEVTDRLCREILAIVIGQEWYPGPARAGGRIDHLWVSPTEAGRLLDCSRRECPGYGLCPAFPSVFWAMANFHTLL